MTPFGKLCLVLLAASLLRGKKSDTPMPVRPIEQYVVRQEGESKTLAGQVLIRDQAGSALLQTDDGALALLQADEILSHTKLEETFEPVTADELSARLLEEMPGFQVYDTPHYLVVYDTSRDYAKWTSSMLERLHKAFVNYWERQGFELYEPRFPLVVTIFANKRNYQQAIARDLGGATEGVVGYYSLESNRVTMFDLTGTEQLRGGNARRSSLKEINRMLTVPAAAPLVATIVHEATHQIAFNCGLQTRYADLPLWLLEGMAVYFEAPDLSSSRGWRGIGKVNYLRLQTFRKNFGKWRNTSLAALVAENDLFRNPRTAGAAYADAWALNYFLIKYRSDEYANYLKMMSEKPALEQDTKPQRLAEFKKHFGDLEELKRDFLEQMARVR